MKSFFILLCVLLIVPVLSGQDAREIMRQVDEQYRPENLHALVEVSVTNRSITFGYTVEVYVKVDAEQKTLALMVFHKPAAVRNTKFLSIEGEGGVAIQWIYLPATRSVRRIVAADQDEAIMGTGYSFSDFNTHPIDEIDYHLLREEEIEGTAAWVIQSDFLEGITAYSKLISWIDKEVLFPLKIEFYDREGRLEKVSTMEEIKSFRERSYPTKNTLVVVETGHQTDIVVKNIEFDVDIPDRYFTPNFLRLGR